MTGSVFRAHALRRRFLLAAPLVLALLSAASFVAATPAAAPPEVQAFLPQARLQGSGRLRWFGLHVYDARLWVGTRFDPTRHAELPLALEIEYARDLAGARIAERSLDEMRRFGEPSPEQAAGWLASLRRILPDVRAGERLTGIQQPGSGAAFFLDGRPLGEIRDPAFARRFFAIWLAPETASPGLRRELIGAE